MTRLFRLQLTVRQLMVVVALAALAMAIPIRNELTRRKTKYLRLAAIHEDAGARLTIMSDGPLKGRVLEYEPRAGKYFARSPAIIEYRSRMKEKYNYAASHPWLPVTPDPPKPN